MFMTLKMSAKKPVLNKVIKLCLILLLAILGFNWQVLFTNNQGTVYAASNLIRGGSFETNYANDWQFWQVPSSSREYEIYRSYESAFGYGSYSLAITSSGGKESMFNAGIQTLSNYAFQVEAGKSYQLNVNTKSIGGSQSMFFFLKRLDNDKTISGVEEVRTGNEWNRAAMTFGPTESAQVQLCFVFGGLSTNDVINIDGVQLFAVSTEMRTSEIKGYIGETNKYITIRDLDYFPEEALEIELPYYDESNREITAKRFKPYKIERDRAYFEMAEGTFAGIGRAWLDGKLLGSFNYNVLPIIDEIHPSVVRADQDLIIYGSGLNPKSGQNFAIVKTRNVEGQTFDAWLEPVTLDTKLKQMTVRVPTGVVPGRIYLYTSFYSLQEKDIVNKSRAVDYQVKPIIYNVEWAKKGYEQVGDKLIIKGKGLAHNPSVNFYDNEDNLIRTNRAKLVNISDTEETIEVEAAKNINKSKITVVVNRIESDQAGALNYEARPRLTGIRGSAQRSISGSRDRIAGSKIGEEISLTGEGFKNGHPSVSVEFAGYNRRITVDIDSADLEENRGNIKVIVPKGAIAGQACLVVNGVKSNCLPLEIIPTIKSISPDPALPGETVTIVAEGIGSDISKTKVHFFLDRYNEEVVSPEAVNMYFESANIVVRAPVHMPHQLKEIKLQHGAWYNDGTETITVQPNISQAMIDLDSRVLTIKGNGFSSNSRDNQIIYKYADEGKTVINPKASMLGVFNTEEGQEIRIRVEDGYHYGWVTVVVDGVSSNEANFGPIKIKRIVRRVEYVASVGAVRGVLYISGYNFGSQGGVKVGNVWADVHYRNEFFIIAVVNPANVYDNPVVVAKE